MLGVIRRGCELSVWGGSKGDGEGEGGEEGPDQGGGASREVPCR